MTKLKTKSKPSCHKFRLQYRSCGVWLNSNTFPTKEAAENYAKTNYNGSRYDGYQVVPLR